MSRLERATIEELRQHSHIQNVAAQSTRLGRSRSGWRGGCPLHDERSPSCVVTWRGWRCFGVCDTGGDVMDLVRCVKRVPFREAVRGLRVRWRQPRRLNAPAEWRVTDAP